MTKKSDNFFGLLCSSRQRMKKYISVSLYRFILNWLYRI